MKTLTMRIFLIPAFLFFLLSTQAFAEPVGKKDTIIVKFGKSRMVIQLKNMEDLDTLKTYNLNKIVAQLEAYFDSTDYKTGDTVVVLKATVEKDGKKNETDINVEMESHEGDDIEKVTINLGKYKFDIDVEDSEKNNGKKNVKINAHKDEKQKRTTTNTNVYLGLNNYLQRGSFPDENGRLFALNPLRSRYIAVNLLQKTRIGREKSPFYLKYGLELSFNNFMFEDNVRIQKLTDSVNFYTDPEDLIKSKFVTTFINIPFMPTLDFGKKGFSIGVGGYAGYRLMSYAKVKLEQDGDKLKDRSNFFINNWRYGVRAEIGLRSVKLFANYDLNSLFAAGKGPELNVFSFGLML